MSQHLEQEEFEPDMTWKMKPVKANENIPVAEVDFFTQVRCPVCHYPLVSRQGKKGPIYTCACKDLD